MGLFDFFKKDENKRRGRVMPGVRGVGTFQPSAISQLDFDNDGIPDDEDDNPYQADNLDQDFLVDRVNNATSEDPFEEDDDNDNDPRDVVELFNNPIGFQFETRELAFKNTSKDMSEKDMILRYQKHPTAENLEPLIAANRDQLKRVVMGLSSMRIPKPAIEGEVYTRFAQQAKTWKPEKNASLITNFKTDKARTLSRDMRQLAQFGKAERGRVSKMERIHSVQELIELSGEEATAEKIAAETGFKLTDVRKALSESTGDLLGSKDLGIGDSGSDDIKIRMAASRVKDFYSGAQRSLVEHMFGLNGNSPVLDNNELARLTSVTPEYVSRFKKKLNERLQTEYQRM